MRWTTRLATGGAQVFWFLALAGMIGSMFVVPKIFVDPPRLTMWNHATVVSRGDDTIVYEFTLDGVTYRGTDRYYGSAGPTALVDIWYDPARPQYSSTREDQKQIGYGLGSLAVLIAPFSAAVIALLMMWRRTRFRMLRYGRLVDATVSRDEPTAGGRLSYVTLRYPLEDGRGDLTVVRRQAVDEPVLYDPARPDHAIALADLTGRPRLDGDRWIPTTLPYGVFLLPLATLAMIGVLLAKSL